MELDIQLFEVESKSGACFGPRKPVQQGLARTTYDTWGSEWGVNIQAGFRERFRAITPLPWVKRGQRCGMDPMIAMVMTQSSVNKTKENLQTDTGAGSARRR